MYGLIRAEHLNAWAGRYTAPAEFPRLVRLLLWALLRAPRAINFPADEAVRLAGYDGQLDIATTEAGLPEGLSVWELGTNSGIKAKADEDYEKRTKNSVGVDRASTTYVFATPRTWPGKAAWAQARSDERIWRRVLAFDAEDLLQWMEQSPAVAVWFGRITGLVPRGIRDLQGSLEDYRLATQPEFDPAGALIGRQLQVEAMLRTLASEPTAIELEAANREEAEAFIGACIASLPQDQQDPQWARALCVDDSDALRQVAAAGEQFLLIVGDGSSPLPANARKHTIVRVVLPGTGSTAAIVLAEPNMRQLIDWVEKQGVERNEAFRRCYDAAGSLERVRRLYLRAGPPPPAWAQPEVAPAVAAAVLVGSWDSGNREDQAFVALVSGADYARFEAAIGSWTLGADPLMTRAGDEWRVHNRQDAWRRLEPYLRTEQLDVFVRAATEVMLEPDPRFDIPPAERWLASMHGKRRPHSESLRKGVADSLLYFATKGDDRQPCYSGVRAQDWAERCVRAIFEHRSEPNFWRRLQGNFTELAEASPEPFLSALEQDLREVHPQILDLFENEGEHGACLHAELLWALELLAWAPVHVGRVAQMLASLAAIDPGGRWSNRPASSLASMLDPMQPQCRATSDERSRLLAALAAVHPGITADLCETLVARNGGILHHSHRPAMRDWAPPERLHPVLVTDYWTDVQAAAKQLLALAGTDAKRWAVLLQNLNQLMPEVKESVFVGIEATHASLPVAEQRQLRQALRKLLHHHNQFADSEKQIGWLYDETILSRLMRLYESLAPDDLIDRHAWLFNFWPERPSDTGTDWQEEQAALDRERMGVAAQLAPMGLQALVDRLDCFENRRSLGSALASCREGDDLAAELFTRHGESPRAEVHELIQGFAQQLHLKDGPAFVERWVRPDGGAPLTEAACAALLLGLPSEATTWDAAEQRGPVCAEAYWRGTHGTPFDRPADGERVARALLGVNRVLDAIDVLAKNSKTDWLAGAGDSELVIEALQRGVEASNANPGQGQRVAYDVTTLLKRLSKCHKVSVETMTQLEWAYFGLLEYQAQHDLVIYRRLSTEPGMVVELLSLLYRPDGVDKESVPEPTETAKRMASNAWHVLNDWRPFAKLSAAEMPSAESLRQYSEAVIQIGQERGYRGIALDHLGKALASSPPGVDGNWPHESVRVVIEHMAAEEELKDGFVVGRINMRGVTSRSIGDGGEQERDLAEKYRKWQGALAMEAPATSGLLGRLAQHYDRDATSIDIDDLRRH